MNKSILTIIVAALCLNFCYGQEKKNCPKPIKTSQNQPYKYDFCGFKSGYKPGYIVTDDVFMKGKSITVRNYTIAQLFALALRLHNNNSNNDTSEKQTSQDQIVIDVRQPEKLNTCYCYKLVVPFYLTDNFYIIMQQSLNEEFPQYTVKMERRGKEDVMVIKDKEL